jgi:hypothetical protein
MAQLTEARMARKSGSAMCKRACRVLIAINANIRT